MKRGLFVCYDPHALMQFLQFYCMNDFPAEWDVLCLPVENGEEYMHSYCEKTKIFKNVFIGEIEYIKLPLSRKIFLFLYMFFFAIIGLRKKCCTKILNEYVENINQYDILCSNIDTGFISGMLASFAKEKEVVYFEDGVADYTIKRSKWKNSVFPVFSLVNLQCVFMAWLGYFAKGFVYFRPTKYCYKYVTNKEALAYKNYKEIREFKLDELAMQKYKSLLKMIYTELNYVSIPEKAVVFFTDPLSNYLDNHERFSNLIINFVSKKWNHICIKRHPRDNDIYTFPSTVNVIELNNHIPAEVFFPFLKDNACCFDDVSSVIIGLKPFAYKIYLFHIKEFEIMKLKIRYRTKVEKIEYLEKFMKDKYEIIEV